ncbi:MAG: hypothetical protein ABW003_11645 [Microvirga sp.]
MNVLQSRIHGLDHWFRVWKNAQLLGGGAASLDSHVDMEVVALFALFHDSMRMNDRDDPDHGVRGYRLWERLNQLHNLEEFLSYRQKETFFEACTDHNKGFISTDPTIAVCWDSDRLDIHRKGIWPDTSFMSTHEAIALCMTRINR